MVKVVLPEAGYATSSTMSEPSKYAMPPPPYFETRFINPSTFKGAISIKLDKPAVSLFRLSVRLFQFAFAMASGISYGIELNHRYSAEITNFIYAEVVFGLTLIVLVIDSITVRYYRSVWIFEYILAVLWLACFGVFYAIYLGGKLDAAYAVVNLGRMERAVWCNLINALLWLASGLFSAVMCCAGMKAAIRGKLERRRQRKQENQVTHKMEQMETGVITDN